MSNSNIKIEKRHLFKRAFHYGKPVFCELNRGLQTIVDFIYPPCCLACNVRIEKYRHLCQNCQSILLKNKAITVYRKQSDFPNLQSSLMLKQAITLWHYDTLIENLIHQVKYQNEMKLGEWLGLQLESQHSWSNLLNHNALILPVPLHVQRYRERGFNQSKHIAIGVQKSLKIPLNTKVLQRYRKTKTQTRLNASGRQQNVEGAFRVINPEIIENKSILLIDDVITTGATVNQCAKTLLAAGSKDVTAFALARPLEYTL